MIVLLAFFRKKINFFLRGSKFVNFSFHSQKMGKFTGLWALNLLVEDVDGLAQIGVCYGLGV